MKLKKLVLATGEEFEDVEVLNLDIQGVLEEEEILGINLLKLKIVEVLNLDIQGVLEEEEILGINLLKLKIDKKEVLINKDFILTLELPKIPKLQTI